MPASPTMVPRLKGLMTLVVARRNFCSGEKRITSGPVTKRSYQLIGAKSLQTLDCTAEALAVREVSPTPSTETPRKPPVATMDAPAFLMSQASYGFAGFFVFEFDSGAKAPGCADWVEAAGVGEAPAPFCPAASLPAPTASPQTSIALSRKWPRPSLPHAREPHPILEWNAWSFKGVGTSPTEVTSIRLTRENNCPLPDDSN